MNKDRALDAAFDRAYRDGWSCSTCAHAEHYADGPFIRWRNCVAPSPDDCPVVVVERGRLGMGRRAAKKTLRVG